MSIYAVWMVDRSRAPERPEAGGVSGENGEHSSAAVDFDVSNRASGLVWGLPRDAARSPGVRSVRGNGVLECDTLQHFLDLERIWRLLEAVVQPVHTRAETLEGRAAGRDVSDDPCWREFDDLEAIPEFPVASEAEHGMALVGLRPFRHESDARLVVPVFDGVVVVSVRVPPSRRQFFGWDRGMLWWHVPRIRRKRERSFGLRTHPPYVGGRSVSGD